jgi:hypothetical protein
MYFMLQKLVYIEENSCQLRIFRYQLSWHVHIVHCLLYSHNNIIYKKSIGKIKIEEQKI